MENILEVEHISKQYPDFALEEISFQLPQGYIMGLIGPNGSGKSTTIKCIMNLIRPDVGQINLFGQKDVGNRSAASFKELKQRIGFVYDQNYFYEELTIAKTKQLIAPHYQDWDDARFDQYLQDFELPLNKKIKKLSKGMKMKLSLAVALAHDPELIIMDEPTSGLDPVFRREMLDMLLDFIQDERKAVFFSTHITTDLESIADYITFIDNGQVIFTDEKEHILDQYGLVKGSLPALEHLNQDELIGLKKAKVGFEALTADAPRLKKGIGSDQVIVNRPSLEDIMYFTDRGKSMQSIRHLVYKDMLIQNWLAYPLAVFFTLFFFATNLNSSFYTVFPCFIAYWLMTFVIQAEAKNDSDTLLNSLPVSRRDIVLAKYVAVFMWVSVALVITGGLAAVVIASFSLSVPYINLGQILLTVVATYLVISVYYPLYFLLGHKYSTPLSMVVVGFVFISLITLQNMWEFNPSFRVGWGAVLQDWALLIGLGAVLASAMITYLSYRLSVYFYSRKEIT